MTQIAQDSGMVARLLRRLATYRQRAAYLFVTAILLMILYAGHSTHWDFTSWIAASVAAASPQGAAAPPGAVAPAVTDDAAIDEGIPLTDDTAAKIGIVVEKASARPMRQTIEAHGVTAYNEDAVAKLSVRVPGHVWRVEKRVGQEVRQGDCLAIIDAVEVGEAKTAYLQAVVDHELKTKLLQRLKTVAKEVAERSLRQAEADAREAQLRLLSTQQKLVNLGFTLQPEDLTAESDEELAARIRLLGIPETIRAQLDPKTVTANLIPLTAPFDGVVIERSATIGEVVNPDHPQFVIADVSRMWIDLDVRKEDAGKVRLGQTIEFAGDGSSSIVSGRVDWISTQLDQATRTLRVRAEVTNPLLDGAPSSAGSERLLKAHTFGSGRIVLRETPDAVVVPAAAVQFDAAGHFVFVRREGSFLRRDVKVGVVEDDTMEILSGLTVGEAVATTGSHVLKAELISIAAE